MAVTFRQLTDADLPLMHRWLNEPGIVEWWEGDDVSWDAVVRDYGSGSEDRTEHWLAVVDGTEVGWIQCFALADEPEDAAPWLALGVDHTAASIDYLVGEPSARGAGLGSVMLRAFVTDVVFRLHPHWTQVAVAPFSANVASCRALEKAGLRLLATVEDPDGPCSLFVLDRHDLDVPAPMPAP